MTDSSLNRNTTILKVAYWAWLKMKEAMRRAHQEGAGAWRHEICGMRCVTFYDIDVDIEEILAGLRSGGEGEQAYRAPQRHCLEVTPPSEGETYMQHSLPAISRTSGEGLGGSPKGGER